MDNDEYSIDLSNTLSTITLTSSPQTGDICINDNTFTVYTDTNDWIDISSLATDTIDIDSIINLDELDISILEPIEFEDRMPDVAKVEDMCNDYPALRKAYENFKTIYKMVHQDWQGKQDAEK